MANRYTTVSLTTTSVTAGATLTINTAFGLSAFDIVSVIVVPGESPPAGGGIFDYKIYKSNSFTLGEELASWLNVIGVSGLFDGCDISAGLPGVEALESFVVPYDDDDATGQLHHSITNHDIVSHKYTIYITYCAAGGSVIIDVNSVPTSSPPNFNNTTPAAPGGSQNVQWQLAGGSISANVPIPATGSYLPSPTAKGGIIGGSLITLSVGGVNSFFTRTGIATGALFGFITGGFARNFCVVLVSSTGGLRRNLVIGSSILTSAADIAANALTLVADYSASPPSTIVSPASFFLLKQNIQPLWVKVTSINGTGTLVLGGWSVEFVSSPISYPFGMVLQDLNVNNSEVTASVSRFSMFFQESGSVSVFKSTENIAYTVMPVAGTFSLLFIEARSRNQDASGSLVISLRVNSANTSLVATFVASTVVPATASDAIHTASCAAGDLVSLGFVNNATVNSCSIYSCTVMFTPTNGSAIIAGSMTNCITSLIAGSTFYFCAFCGGDDSATLPATTAAAAGFPLPRAGTIKNLYVYVATASVAGTIVCTLYVNEVATALQITIGATVTGKVSDLTHSVNTNLGDRIALQVVNNGSGTIRLTSWSAEFA